MAAADPLVTTLATAAATAITHIVRSYATLKKGNSSVGVAEIKDRAALTAELWKRLEKVEQAHEECEAKHDECLSRVSTLSNKIERLEARVSHIEP